ncbi:protein PHLOEM PROTEIN 2-LIKE A1-like [Syzygium oleosum]|uniref:protein PHLOEM PROTEIN 2-LIKE A1-like n=1 Tax=Syzygium oleosum TaxID=219896 RepID=UPI0024BB2C9E|nr:protein PHLOEM PROTEIN 2-LIKE A1-like [Syzygium oleosum]
MSHSMITALGLQKPPYTHKYWVDEELNRNCLMVLAPALSITWGNDRRYWTWPEEGESCYWGNENLPVAELGRVCWLEIKGKCETIVLSPRTMYEVAIFVKMGSRNHGWEIPVNLSLQLPDGNKQGRMARLDSLKKETWTPLSIGKFETTPKTIGEISFSLTQTDGHWKSGLRVKGVVITPTTENKQPK